MKGRKEHHSELVAEIARWVRGFDSFDSFEAALAAVGLPAGLARTGGRTWPPPAGPRTTARFVPLDDRAGRPHRRGLRCHGKIDGIAVTHGQPYNTAYRGEHNHEILCETLPASTPPS